MGRETDIMSFRYLILLACVVGLNAAYIRRTTGACPNVATKEAFDYKQYAGVWYEIKRMPVIFEAGMTCVQAEYGEISEGLVSVRNTAYLANGAVTDISGTATEPFPDQPGYLEVKFPYRPPADYRVLDTDYTTFTSIYSCTNVGPLKFEFGWVLSRTNTLSDSQLEHALSAFTKEGIDATKLVTSYQSDDCKYI